MITILTHSLSLFKENLSHLLNTNIVIPIQNLQWLFWYSTHLGLDCLGLEKEEMSLPQPIPLFRWHVLALLEGFHLKITPQRGCGLVDKQQICLQNVNKQISWLADSIIFLSFLPKPSNLKSTTTKPSPDKPCSC